MIASRIFLTGLFFFVIMVIIARNDKSGKTTQGDGLNLFCGIVYLLSLLFILIGALGWIWGY